jgi:hypothetical protein
MFDRHRSKVTSKPSTEVHSELPIPGPSHRPAGLFAAIVLAACGGSGTTTSTRAVATVGSGGEATLTQTSVTSGFPNSMVVLGHSGATGEDSDPSQPHIEIRANSCATRTTPP